MILCIVLGTIFGVYKSVTQVKPYEAFGRIEVNNGSSNEFKLSPFSALGDDPQQKMMSQIAIITSDTLLSTVAKEMNLANNPDFLGVKGPVPHRSMEDPRVRQSGRGNFAARIEGNPGPKDRHHPHQLQQPEPQALSRCRQ